MNTEVHGARFQKAADWRKDLRGTASTMLQGTAEQEAFNTLDRVGNRLERKIGWFYGKLAIVNTTKKSSSGPSFTRNWMGVSDTRNARTREVTRQLFEKSAAGIRDELARDTFLAKVNRYLQENPDTRIRGGKNNAFSQLVKELRTLRTAHEPNDPLAQKHPGQAAHQAQGSAQEPGPSEARHADLGNPSVVQPDPVPQRQAPAEAAPDPWIALPDNSVATGRAASVYLKRSPTDLRLPADREPVIHMPVPGAKQGYPEDESVTEPDIDPSEVSDLDESERRSNDAETHAFLLANARRDQFIDAAGRALLTLSGTLSAAEDDLEQIEAGVEGWMGQWRDLASQPANALRLRSNEELRSILVSEEINQELERLKSALEDSLRGLDKLKPGAAQAGEAAERFPNGDSDQRVRKLKDDSTRLEAFAQDGLTRLNQLSDQLAGLFEEVVALRDVQLAEIETESQTLSRELDDTISKSTDALAQIRPRLETALNKQATALTNRIAAGRLAESNAEIAAQALRLAGRDVLGEPRQIGLIDQLEEAVANARDRKTSLLEMGLTPQDPMVANFDELARRAQLRLDEARTLLGTAVTRNLEAVPQADRVAEPGPVKASVPDNPRLADLLTNPTRQRSEPDPALGQNVNALIARQERLGLVLAWASRMIEQDQPVNDRQRGQIETMINRVNGSGSSALAALRERALADLDARVTLAEQGLDQAIEGTLEQLRAQARTEREALQDLRHDAASHGKVITAVSDILEVARAFEEGIADVQMAMNELSKDIDDPERQAEVTSAIEKARKQAERLDQVLVSAADIEGFKEMPGLSDTEWVSAFESVFDEISEEDQQADSDDRAEAVLTRRLDALTRQLTSGQGVHPELAVADEIQSKIESQTRRVQAMDEQVATFTRRFGESPRSSPGPVLRGLKDALAGDADLQPALEAFGSVALSISGNAFKRLGEAIERRRIVEAAVAEFDRDLETYRSWVNRQER